MTLSLYYISFETHCTLLFFFLIVGPIGFEPMTPRLSDEYSKTTELRSRMPTSFNLSVGFRCRVKILYLFLSHFYTLIYFLFGDDFHSLLVKTFNIHKRI